jgi:transcriptional regulator with XRE-family HTH domain/tetratricopeptide (TPR) repeat protein
MSETFGAAVRRLRVQRGMSLRELARQVHVDPGHLSRIEADKRAATGPIGDAIDQALHADGTLLARIGQAPGSRYVLGTAWRRSDAEALASALVQHRIDPGCAVRLAHDWMITEPPQVYEVRAGRRVGDSAVRQVEQRLRQLRVLDDHVGGAETYPLLDTEVAATAALIRDASYTERVGRRLLGVLAELCQLAGWVSSDAGRHAEAQRFYLVGLRAAHAADDRPGAANNLSSLAYQVSNVGDPREAVTLARSAYCGARHVGTAMTRALLLERVAWAHAKAGDGEAAARTLGDVEDAYDQGGADDDPGWVYWLDRDEVDIMAGRCWTELERPLRAVPLLERVTAHYNTDAAREIALYLTWLAEALIQAREIDRAADVALRALRLGGQTGSTRVAARIHMLRRTLSADHGNVAVDTFEEACRDNG